ncbi:MAG TPA: porin [Usitatibacter sp.]|nr:porin [Usitatibacter sp.]
MHNKKLLALAVGAALAYPALCAAKGEKASEADSVVELYGRIYPELIREYGKDPTDAGTVVSTLSAAPTGNKSIITRNEMESSNSRLGVRGQERLGPNLKAIFQLETAFAVDSNTAAFAQRDSFVGLTDERWGTIKLGRMDTPFKSYGDDLSFLGVSSGNFVSSSNVLRKTGFGTSSASSFHLRRANVVQYESPVIGGFDGALQYSTDETDTATRKPHVWSGAVKWEGGPFVISLAHEIHWDLFGGSRNVPTAQSNFNDQSVNAKDKATQGMIQWKFGPHTLEADFIQKEYNENANITGRFSNYKNTAWEVAWDTRWNAQWRTALEYIKSNKGSCSRVNAECTTDGLDGSQVQFGVAYYFSKRSYLFAMGALLRNGYSATYNNSASQAPSVGEDIEQWAFGMSHSF